MGLMVAALRLVRDLRRHHSGKPMCLEKLLVST